MVVHFYIGIDRRWMFQIVSKPMVSFNAPAARTLPLHEKASSFMDSGAFSVLKKHGRYPWSPDDFKRVIAKSGPTFFTQMDWPCEPSVRASTGLTVDDHIRLSVESAREVASWELEGSTFVPTVQGWRLQDYIRCAELLEAEGLWGDYIAVGSVCRRGQVSSILAVARALKDFSPGLRLHGFGIKTNPEVLAEFYSADSFAWCLRARFDLLEKRGSKYADMALLDPYLRAYVEKTRAWETQTNGLKVRQQSLVGYNRGSGSG